MYTSLAPDSAPMKDQPSAGLNLPTIPEEGHGTRLGCVDKPRQVAVRVPVISLCYVRCWHALGVSPLHRKCKFNLRGMSTVGMYLVLLLASYAHIASQKMPTEHATLCLHLHFYKLYRIH